MMARMLVGALFLSGLAMAQPRKPGTPVLVELFTSEGCSSCPPADAVLARLDKEQPIAGAEALVLSEHVDYWNNLGWRDPFSSPLFSARQQDYGQAMRLKDVFTPQIVVNGQTQVIGSDWDAVKNAVRAAVQTPRAWVRLAGGGDRVTYEVQHLPAGTRSADIFLAITESGLETLVASGENGGHRLQHTGVVRSLVSLGTLDTRQKGAASGEARLTRRPEWFRANLKVILFVQDRETRRIVGLSSVRWN